MLLVRWSPSGSQILTFDSWGTVVLWKNRTGVLSFEYEITGLPPLKDMQWSSCSSRFITCAEDGHVQLINAMDGTCVFMLQIISTTHHSVRTSFTCCTWNHSNSHIVMGTRDGEVIEIDITDFGQILATTETRCAPVNSLEWFFNEKGIESMQYMYPH